MSLPRGYSWSTLVALVGFAYGWMGERLESTISPPLQQHQRWVDAGVIDTVVGTSVSAARAQVTCAVVVAFVMSLVS